MKMEIGQAFIPYKVFNGNIFPLMQWLVEKQIVTHTEKELLIILNSYAFKDGKCYPAIKTLSQKIGLSERQVIRLLHSLEDKGILQIDRPTLLQRHVFRRHNHYSFLWTVFYEMYLSEFTQMSSENSTQMSGGIKENLQVSKSKENPASGTLCMVKGTMSEIQALTKSVDREVIATGKRFDSAKFVGSALKRNIHLQAIIDALKSVQKNLPVIQDVWSYAERILQIRSGNYHERDFVRSSQALKQEIESKPVLSVFRDFCLQAI